MGKTISSEPRVTHVSINAKDVRESVDFYVDLLGCEALSDPQLEAQEDLTSDECIRFQNVRIGDLDLHIWNDPGQDVEELRFAHFAIHSDDFEEIYVEAERRDIFAGLGVSKAPPRVWDFNGNAQMYLRDPTGNLVEIDYPDITELDQSLFAEVVERKNTNPNAGVYPNALLKSLLND